MNTRINITLLAALLGVFFTADLNAQTTAFTYQGQLAENGMPANGIYDLKFELWQPKGSVGVITNTATTVSNGLFTVMLDFGWAPFTGADLWLEIGVVTNGGATFVTLSPRQFISSAPYAIQAATASVAEYVSGDVSADQLTGTIAPANIAAGTITSSMLATGSVTAVQLAAGAVGTEQLATGSVTSAQLALGSVGTEQLATGTVFNGNFIGDASSLSNLNSTRLTGPLTVDPGALANIGHIDNGGDAYGVALAGNYAYLANRSDGLRIYDISDPANPVNIGHTNDGWTARDVAVSGGYAYLANWDDGLRVYDISDPANPTNVGHTNDGGIALGVAVSGNYAYLANYGDGLRVYDISDPANPVNVGHTNDVGNARGVAVSGNYAFLANENDGLRVYDISDPANPANVGHVDDNGGYAQGVAVSGNYAYLANTTDGLRVYDISNPANPVNIGHIDDGGSAQSVTVSGNYAYLANTTDGLRVYDISDPANPVNIGHANNGGTAYGVAVSGGHAFLANYDDGLRVYSIGLVSGPGFAGNGSGLTSLSASQLTSGTLSSARFSGTYSNALILGNASNSFNGTFAGDGSGLSGVHSLDAADGSPTDAVYVDNEGNVGVGTNNPASALHVAGTVTADGFAGPIAANQLTGTIAPANIAAGTITTTMLAPGSVTPSELDPSIGIWTQMDTNIHWSGGSVGIGTSTPRERLEVEGGNIRIQGVDGYDVNGESAYLYLGGTPNYIKATRGFGLNLGTAGAPDAVTLRHTGYVGIGTNDPTEKLDVNGTVKAIAFVGDGSGLTNLPVWDDSDWVITGNDMYADVSGNVGVGTTSPNEKLHVGGNVEANGNFRAYGGYQYTSSRTFHKNIPPSSFVPKDSREDDEYVMSEAGYGSIAIISSGGIGAIDLDMRSPVYLPQGAVVTGLKYFYYDNDASSDVHTIVTLVRRGVLSTSIDIVAQAATVSAGSSITVQQSSGIVVNSDPFDDQNHMYFIDLNFNLTSSGLDKRFYGAQIEYTLTDLKP